MKSIIRVALLAILWPSQIGFAQINEELSEEMSDSLLFAMQLQVDSVENSFHYQKGEIQLPGCHATLTVPDGFGYLDAIQAKRVMEELWGNPPSDSKGMLVPDGGGVLQDESWAFEITWDDMGYVKDDDAMDTDYDELLTSMQSDLEEENKMRVEQGFPTVKLIAWASPPYYDAQNKVLHWAKNLEFQDMGFNTLNYNVRILGRNGVMVMNAIGSMEQLEMVKSNIPAVLNSMKFDKGHQYGDFDSSVDKVAAYTIGGLIAGKVLAKVGLFAVIAKFGKLILLGLAGAGAAIWRWLSGRKKDEKLPTDENPNLLQP